MVTQKTLDLLFMVRIHAPEDFQNYPLRVVLEILCGTGI